jgi:hypothetical protein
LFSSIGVNQKDSRKYKKDKTLSLHKQLEALLNMQDQRTRQQKRIFLEPLIVRLADRFFGGFACARTVLNFVRCNVEHQFFIRRTCVYPAKNARPALP